GHLDDLPPHVVDWPPIRLPPDDRGLVALTVLPEPGRQRRDRRATRLPTPCRHRLGVLRLVPVQPSGARLEHPAAVHRTPLHPLSAPLRRALMRRSGRAAGAFETILDAVPPA